MVSLIASEERPVMAEDNQDISMMLLDAGGAQLVSRELALTVAESVFKTVFGEDDFTTQLPLNAKDGGDRWIIEGSRRAEDHPPPEGQPAKGKVEIVILKSNCRIVKLLQHSRLESPFTLNLPPKR